MGQGRNRRGRAWAGALGALAALALVPALAAGQSMDSRWLPWVGCWQPSGVGVSSDLIVCASPQAAGRGIEVTTVSDGQVVGTRTLVADGQRHEITEDECTGWQTARFSADGRRVFLRSELTCESGEPRTASAIMALPTPSQWLDAQAIGMGEERAARVIRYTPVSVERIRAAGLEPPAPERVAAISDARLLAAAELSLDDVKEAAREVDPEALEAYLVERGSGFELDAARLADLADSGVSESVIDLVVALSFPDRFAIDRGAMDAQMRPAERAERAAEYDPFGWGRYGRRALGYGYGYGCYDTWNIGLYGWDPFLINPYGYYGYGGCYDPYGYRYGFRTRPVIVVIGDPSDIEAEPQGRLINGRGYTRGGSASTNPRRARPIGASGGRAASSGSVDRSSGRADTGKATSGGYTRGSGSSGSAAGSSSGRSARKKGGG